MPNLHLRGTGLNHSEGIFTIMFCVSQQVLRYRDSVSMCFATVFMGECFLKVFNCYEFQALYQYMTKFRGVKGVFHF